MDLDTYIHEAIFEEKDKYAFLYELIWQNFTEDGFVITDEPDHEVDSVLKAVGIQNLIGEFVYRLYDEINETGFEDVVEYLANVGVSEDKIIEYCENHPEIDCDDDSDLTIKNALDYTTEIVADKMMEMFASDEIFDYMFAATYDFEQDFVFAFEDVDEFQAFVDANTEKLDNYKEEYPSVLRWIESGMIV